MDLPSDLKHLFVTWLEAERDKVEKFNSNLATVYGRALESVRGSSIVLQHPNQLQKLPYVGPKIVAMVLKRLATYCEENGYNLPPEPEQARQEGAKGDDASKKRKAPAARRKSTKKYVPAKRSGGYAILITLFGYDRRRSGMTKGEIIEHAAQFCETSFEPNPTTGKFYSAWQSVKTLMNKELVVAEGRPLRYSLTDEGAQIAQTLCLEDTPSRVLKEAVVPPEPVSSPLRKTASAQGEPYVIWGANDYSVMLLLDNREIKSKDNRNFFSNTLQRMGVANETRALSIGDAVWIAKHNRTGKEAILDFILERKRLDDLVGSIKDGRFTEQKSRLKRTGIEHVYYLIEEQTSRDVSYMGDAMQTAISATITTSKFHVKRTNDTEDTAHFLSNLTTEIRNFYRGHPIAVMQLGNLNSQGEYAKRLAKYRSELGGVKCAHSFETLQSVLSKSDMVTVGEMFIRMLMAIKGVSLEKAVVIQQRYGTPKKLVQAYCECYGDRSKMLSEAFKDEVGSKKIGPALSEKISAVWS